MTPKHPNLFDGGYTKAEIYAALQQHYGRDVKRYTLWEVAFAVCAIGAALVSGHLDWLWAFGGLFALSNRLSLYIDNSNRNWTMHLLDWQQRDASGKPLTLDAEDETRIAE